MRLIRATIGQAGLLLAMLLLSCQADSVSARVIEPSYFGLHVFYLGGPTKWPTVQFGSLRTHDGMGTRWYEIEGQPDQWNFVTLDRYVAESEKHGVDVLVTLGQTPRWASARPSESASYGLGVAAEPKNNGDWERYVRKVATRYKGRVHYYQIWNEPRFSDLYPWRGTGYFSGTTAQMVELSRIAYEVIKEVDASATVISPSFDGDRHAVKKLDKFLQLGGGKFIDAVALHLYLIRSLQPEPMTELIAEVQAVLKQRGHKNLPIWNTESGYIVGPPSPTVRPMDTQGFLSRVLDEREATGYMAREMILGAWLGLVRFYWFAWDSGSMGMLDHGKPRSPNGLARGYNGLYRWLVNVDLTECTRSASGLWRCALRDVVSNRAAAIYWSDSGAEEVRIQTRGVIVTELLDGKASILSGAEGDWVKVNVDGTPILVAPGTGYWKPGATNH
jgi:hypothetical protein